MDGVTITEWKRYGKHRGYAKDELGNDLGYIDVASQELFLEPGADAAGVGAVLRMWAAARSTSASPAAGAARDVATPKTAWHDLASNRPGQLSREKARQAWETEKQVAPFVGRVARVLNVHTPERAYRKGAEGEEKVGPILDKLEKHGWRTLHSIPVGERGDIDHLSIGPGGVVLFNTKYHRGARFSSNASGVFVNGARTDYVTQIREQARGAFERLKAAGAPVTFVTPWLVLVNGGLLQPEAKLGPSPKGVSITTNHNLKINLRRMEPVLTPERVHEIYEVARRSTTWE